MCSLGAIATDPALPVSLWATAMLLMAAAGFCFRTRRFRMLFLVIPCFLAFTGFGAFCAFRALGAPYLVWPLLALEIYVVAASVLFLIDMQLGVWALDMTYPMLACWIVAPVALLIHTGAVVALLIRAL